MPTPQTVALGKIVQSVASLQRLQDRENAAAAHPGMDSSAAAKIALAVADLEAAQAHMIEAIAIQAAVA